VCMCIWDGGQLDPSRTRACMSECVRVCVCVFVSAAMFARLSSVKQVAHNLSETQLTKEEEEEEEGTCNKWGRWARPRKTLN
jgi:hypothetical protein